MLKINKDNLKELILTNIYQYIESTYSDRLITDHDFKFEFDENKENIIFTCAIKEINRGNHWKRYYEENDLDISYFNISSINDYLKNFFTNINEVEIIDTNLNTLNKYPITYDSRPNLNEILFFDEDVMPGDYDYYDNHNELRTILIPIERIADFIISYQFTKDLSEYENLFPNIDFKKEENKKFLIMINQELSNVSLIDNQTSKLKI